MHISLDNTYTLFYDNEIAAIIEEEGVEAYAEYWYRQETEGLQYQEELPARNRHEGEDL